MADAHLDFNVLRKQSRLHNPHRLCRGNASRPGHVMKFTLAAATCLTVATLASTASAAPGHRPLPCLARVVHSEELPFAPINSWLVKVTLEITPPHGNTYQTTVQDWMPWQGPPPRRGQAFRVQCDPANPGNLHLISQTATPTAF
jgi:hypothetical protein